MNERIRELMLEAGYAAPELAGRGKKLAELVIQHCATVADFAHLGGVVEPGAMIREYFGIEQ